MILSRPLETPRLLLRTLQAEDASEAYLAWLTDPAVNRHLEVRFQDDLALENLREFVASHNASDDTLLLGIFLAHDGRHIGTIKLGPIVERHARSELGFMIGEKSYWGMGYAPEAIMAVSRYGIEELGLAKITAGCYETNVGSSKALLKAGFVHEGTRPSHVIFEGRRIATEFYGLLR